MKILESNWEQHFIQESQLLEDKLARGEITPMSSRLGSRLALALENNILEWANYSVWAQQNYLLPVLKRGLYKDQVITLQKKISSFKAEFSKFDLQKFQMIAIDKWENKLIILGLEPLEALNSMNIEYILVLTPPEIITTLMGEALHEAPLMAIPGAVPAPPVPMAKETAADAAALFDLSDQLKSGETHSPDEDSKNDSDDNSSEKLTPLDLPKFDDHEFGETNVNFNELLVPGSTENSAKPVAQAPVKTETAKPISKAPIESSNLIDNDSSNGNFVSSIDNIQYWNKINQEHNTLSADARKYFDGYAVLKITNSKTELFKLDEELQAEKLEASLFQFNLNDPFFTNLLKSKTTDSVSLKILGKTILDFNYVCATPLFLGEKPVGFILGFKINAMNEQDENALYRLMQSA